jgi:carboxymethylenebutenolidase
LSSIPDHPAYERVPKDAGKDYRVFIYKGANHGFHSDTTPRHDQAAAVLAWDRTMGFFADKLH